ncbi:MAG: hypothetical protein KAJ49_06940 [Arcobacteraceae bacterium]|nr:hypothetical protein [Arcobacteraceae bacterium]
MSKKKGLSKRAIYIIFIGKFLFSLALIAWTITMTIGAGVGLDDDNTFLSTYHKVDENFNNIVNSNNDFNKKYNMKLEINGKEVKNLSYDDIFLSQRVIRDRKIRKSILSFGKNDVLLTVTNRSTNKIVKNIDATLMFTMRSSHNFDEKLIIKDGNKVAIANIGKRSHWNIMGTVTIEDDEGYFFIKTNAK